MILSHHRPKLRLHRSALPSVFPVFWPLISPFTLYLAAHALLLRVRPPSTSAFLILNGVTSLLADPHHLDPSFAPTRPFSLPCLLCSQPRYSSGTLIVTLPRVCSLAVLLNTSFLVAFATESLSCLGFCLVFGVRCAIFGTLCTDA